MNKKKNKKQKKPPRLIDLLNANWLINFLHYTT